MSVWIVASASSSRAFLLVASLSAGFLSCSSAAESEEQSLSSMPGDGAQPGMPGGAAADPAIVDTPPQVAPPGAGGAPVAGTGGAGGAAELPLEPAAGGGAGAPPTVAIPTAPDQSDASLGVAIQQLDIWKITLPIQNLSNPGRPLTIEQPAFQTAVHAPWYYLSTDNEAVFAALCACDDEALAAGREDCGYHTTTSSYARSELREDAAWTTSVGEHIMETDVTITRVATTTEKRDVAVNQIHDETDDIVLVRLREARGTARFGPNGEVFCAQGCPAPLVVEGSPLGEDGKPLGQGDSVWYTVLDPNYVVGTPFRTRIHAHSGQVDVYFAYGDAPLELATTIPADTTGCYFKAGCYNHTGMKPDKGMCQPGDYAETRFSRIDVTHSPEL